MTFPSRSHAMRVTSLLTLLSILACTTWRVETRPLPEVVAERSLDKLRVTLTDSTSAVLREPSLQADTLTGRATWGVVAIPVAHVAYVATHRVSAPATVGLILGSLTVAAGVGLVIFAPTFDPWG